MSKKKIYVDIPVNYVCIHSSKIEEAAREETELRALIRELKHELDDAINKLESVRSDLVEAQQKNDKLVEEINRKEDFIGDLCTRLDRANKMLGMVTNAKPEEA